MSSVTLGGALQRLKNFWKGQQDLMKDAVESHYRECLVFKTRDDHPFSVPQWGNLQ